MALRSQSFNERRAAPAVARAQPHSDGELSDEVEDSSAINGKGKIFTTFYIITESYLCIGILQIILGKNHKVIDF